MNDEVWEEERQEYINVIRWLQNQVAFMKAFNKMGELEIQIRDDAIHLVRTGYGFASQEYESIATFDTPEELFDALTDGDYLKGVLSA